MPPVSLAELVAAARLGDRLISFPTDTVPALAVRPDRAALIFAAKQRSQTKPLILMAANPADWWAYVQGSAAEQAIWRQVTEHYLPGALTLVLPASDRLPPEINPTDPTTIGLRVPDHAIARYILSMTGPLATTSANRSGQPPLQTMADINAQFPEVLTLHPSDLASLPPNINLAEPQSQLRSPLPTSGIPSTVVKWTGNGWTILRQGSVNFEEK